MPSTVPWRFWGDGTLGLGLGCWAAAIGAAARHVANVRRLREGIWFTAIPRWFGVGIAYSMPCSGRGSNGFEGGCLSFLGTRPAGGRNGERIQLIRSEEHTSELQ